MKIAVLHGQKHHGSTWNTTRLLLDSLIAAEDECIEFFANDIPDCVGCFTCIMNDEEKYPHRSVTKPVIQAIEQKVRRRLRQYLLFKIMGRMQKSGFGMRKDSAYWKEQGWI